MKSKLLNDKTVWITGASSGIGRALAVECFRQGARLILSSRNEDQLAALRESLLPAGGPEDPREEHILIRRLDVTDPAAIERVTDELFERFRRIDLLFLAAGVSQRSLGMETDISVVRQIMETNFFGPINLAKAALSRMREPEGTRIVVVSSVFGKFGAPARTGYAASKHALHGYFDSLRTELPRGGVAVTLVTPGAIATNIANNALTGDGSTHGQRDEEIERGMSAERCARVILRAIGRNRDEVTVGFGFKLHFALALKLVAPRLLTRILRRRL